MSTFIDEPKKPYIHRRATWHEGEKSTREPETVFRRSAGVSIKPVDLIHPNEASNLPGTCGYVPQLMFKDGHTYGARTHKLTNRYTRNEKLQHKRPDNTESKENFLPTSGGDHKFTEKMVPGYTGYVPQHDFTYGLTYKEGTEQAICQTRRSYSEHAEKLATLQRNVNTNPKLEISPRALPHDPDHPSKSPRFMFSYYRSSNPPGKEFQEAAIPGYMGTVPQKENNILGQRYSVWNGNAFQASQALREKEETVATQRILPPSTNKMDAMMTGSNPQCGQIYNKHLGMVPKYTGYVPQRRFRYENTYGDSTRSLPICKDSPGYSTGRYIDTGPKIDMTVSPVRDQFLHRQKQAVACAE